MDASTMPAYPAAANAAAIAQLIPLAFLQPSPTNPRKHFDQDALDELTASVKKHGVMQPVLVRAASSPKDKRILWEVVAGERRYRAAKAAGLEAIPAVTRTLTDAETLELQLVENLQRADLHPLEEAEGYERLQKLHGYGVDDLAAKVGKSKAYVYARLKLTALTPKSREAFYAGKLNPSTALLVARIPVPTLQDQATGEITKPGWNGEAMSVRTAIAYLQEHYMLRLADAPFPTADEKLLPRAGSCAACPKRTGNARDLFNDVKSADVCTDPSCFDAKKSAHVARLTAAAAAKGQRVITGKDAKKIVPYDSVDERSGYIELDARNYDDSKGRTFRELLGKACPTPALVQDKAGRLREVVERKEVAPLLKEKLPARASSGNDAQKKREAKARLETSIRSAIFDAIAAAYPGAMTVADAALIAAALFDRSDHECVKRVLKRWEPEAATKAGDTGLWDIKRAFAKRIPALSSTELASLMVQLALSTEIHVGAYSPSSKPEALHATAARVGVDAEEIRRRLNAAAKEKTRKPVKAKAAATKKPARPKTRPAAAAATTTTTEKS